MKLNKVLRELNFEIGKEELGDIKSKTKLIKNNLKNEIKRHRIKADVFLGGSFAKGTLMREKEYDVDIFARFNKENDIELLQKIVKKLKSEKVHGSRDYFRIIQGDMRFEIIPVLKISKPKQAENVTDLSYFHVNYVKKKINTKIAREIALAKAFFKASGVYGAESYIRGISGYGVECLLIYYKTFEKMAKALSNLKDDEKLIIDIEKQYKNKNDILIDINESKSQGPIILVDPTWRERNVLAALSNETFFKLKENLKKFLHNPSKSYFEIKEIDINRLKKSAKDNNYEFLTINLRTDKQEGDIAGTKLKKFSLFLEEEIKKYFKIIKDEFEYDDEKQANLHLIAKPNKEVVKTGPPINMKNEVNRFKKMNKNTFIKNNRIYSRIKINFSCKKFIQEFQRKYADKIKSMDITEIRTN